MNWKELAKKCMNSVEFGAGVNPLPQWLRERPDLLVALAAKAAARDLAAEEGVVARLQIVPRAA